MPVIKTIMASEAELGMYIHDLNCSWIRHPFWKASFLLEQPEDLQRIRNSGLNEIRIDLSKSLHQAPPPPAEDDLSPVVEPADPGDAREIVQKSAIVRVSMGEEMRRAADLCARSRKAVFDMFSDVRMGKAISGQAAQDMVEEISASVSWPAWRSGVVAISIPGFSRLSSRPWASIPWVHLCGSRATDWPW